MIRIIIYMIDISSRWFRIGSTNLHPIWWLNENLNLIIFSMLPSGTKREVMVCAAVVLNLVVGWLGWWGHCMQFVQLHCRILAYQYSFFPSGICLWNQLPARPSSVSCIFGPVQEQAEPPDTPLDSFQFKGILWDFFIFTLEQIKLS